MLFNCYEIKVGRYGIEFRTYTALLRTEEVLEAKFYVSFSHIVCRMHNVMLGGKIAYLEFVLITISRFNVFLVTCTSIGK